MSTRTKRFVFIPVGALLVLGLTVFLLGRFGMVSMPWSPEDAGKSVASKSDDKKDKKGKDGEEEEEIIPVPVELARAEARQISAYYRASSFIEADRQVDLVSKTQGRVQAISSEEGEWVSRGDVLAELENGRERIQLRQATLKLKDQQRELGRRETLLNQRLITQEEFDATRSAFDLAQTDKDLAEIALEETIIRAPFDGQVTTRMIVPGQHINISQSLFSLVDFEPLRVRIHLPEVVARRVNAGDRVEVVVEALSNPIPATVERVSPIVDPTTSTVKLTLLIEGDPKEIRVGGFVKVRITTDTHVEALAIPKLALVEEGGLRSVFIAEADTVRKVEVRTGLYDESHCEILEGLEEGMAIVTLGQGGLRNGNVIDVLNADAVGWVSVAKSDEDETNDEEDGEPEDTSDVAEGGSAEVAMSDETAGSE